LALADREGDVVDRVDLADGAPQHTLLDREVLLQIDNVEHGRAVVTCSADRNPVAGGGANHKASPNASRPPNARDASAHRAGRTSGSARRHRGSAARTNIPAAGWSAPAPDPGSPGDGHWPLHR